MFRSEYNRRLAGDRVTHPTKFGQVSTVIPVQPASSNSHIAPISPFWRRPGAIGRRAGLNLIAALLGEGSPSPIVHGQVRMVKWVQCASSSESRPVSRVLSWAIIHLGLLSPASSSDLPEDIAGRDIVFLFGLAPGGVYLATNCYQLRGALLPHHFTLTCPHQ